jgi:hypothetical protein
VDCSIELDFADGKYLFALPLPRLQELQVKCDIGIGGLHSRLLRGCIPTKDGISFSPAHADFYALDLIETIRQGLIGGARGVVNGEEVKVTPAMAERLITNYVLDRPLVDNWQLAVSIICATMTGYDPPKKEPPAQEPAPEAEEATAG